MVVIVGPWCQIVDRLAFPHAGLGQVQLGLDTKSCVLHTHPFSDMILGLSLLVYCAVKDDGLSVDS